MRSKNPLAGIPVKSLDDLAAAVVDRFGTAKIDLSDPDVRLLFQDALLVELRRLFSWELERMVETACGRAVKHIFGLMGNDKYQAQKAAARVRYAEKKRVKQGKTGRQIEIERQLSRKTTGVVN